MGDLSYSESDNWYAPLPCATWLGKRQRGTAFPDALHVQQRSHRRPQQHKVLTGHPTGNESPPCLSLGLTQPAPAPFTSRSPPILPARRKGGKSYVNIVYCLITSPSESKTTCSLSRHLYLLPTTGCRYLSCLSVCAQTANANNAWPNPSTASNRTNTPPHTAH